MFVRQQHRQSYRSYRPVPHQGRKRKGDEGEIRGKEEEERGEEEGGRWGEQAVRGRVLDELKILQDPDEVDALVSIVSQLKEENIPLFERVLHRRGISESLAVLSETLVSLFFLFFSLSFSRAGLPPSLPLSLLFLSFCLSLSSTPTGVGMDCSIDAPVELAWPSESMIISISLYTIVIVMMS